MCNDYHYLIQILFKVMALRDTIKKYLDRYNRYQYYEMVGKVLFNNYQTPAARCIFLFKF